MIRYAYEENCQFVLSNQGKFVNVVISVSGLLASRIQHPTGIYLWPDDGTVILVNQPYARLETMQFIAYKTQLKISAFNAPTDKDNYVLPGTIVASLIPVATAYFGNVELEQIRSEWFDETD